MSLETQWKKSWKHGLERNPRSNTGFFQGRVFQLVFHWVSKLIHLTRIRCSGWVRDAWIINEFENYVVHITVDWIKSCRKKLVTGFERKWTRRSFRSYYHALKFICFSLSTTVATQCTFQSSHCWFIDYYRHHTTWSTQTKLHHCSYMYLSRSETILLTHSTEDLIAFIGVFHIPFKSNTKKHKKYILHIIKKTMIFYRYHFHCINVSTAFGK